MKDKQSLIDAYISTITYDDLADDMRLIADACGMDVVRSLLRNCSGVRVYIPSPYYLNNSLKRFLSSLDEKGHLSGVEIKRITVAFGVAYNTIDKWITEGREERISSRASRDLPAMQTARDRYFHPSEEA